MNAEDTEENPKLWRTEGGAIFAYVRIRGEPFAVTTGHAAPKFKGHKSKHSVAVCSDTDRIGSSVLGKLVCSFENDVDEVSGVLRNWALIKLDKDRFGDSLPRNQTSPLETYDFRYSLQYSLVSFNDAHLPGGRSSLRSLINSTKTESHFFNSASLVSLTSVADNGCSSTSPNKHLEASPQSDEPQVTVARVHREREGRSLPKETCIKVVKHGRATGWTAGALNHIASSIRVPGGNGERITVTCLSVLNYNPRGLLVHDQ